ncbi:MAG: protein kinase [Candidatus Riflebacteria bacterium]|nr:protein kinase [Candidatus Riflebacteria bacterium]
MLQAGLGRYKLTDFGIAKSSAAGVKTAVNVLLGTPTYMAPEQIVGLPYCVQSDLYALGILLFELLTGDPPFDSDDPTKVLEMHLDAEPPCPSRRTTGLPEELDDVVLRSLGKEASDRFADAAAMRLALEAIPVDPPPSAGGPAEAPGRSVKSGAPVPRPGRFHMFKARDTFRRLRGGGRVALALAVVLCAAALLSVGRPARTVVAPPAAPEPSVTLPGPRMAAAAAAVDAAKTCAVAWAGHLSHLEGRVLNTRIAETCRMMEGLARQFVERQGPLAAIVEELRTLGPDPSTLSLRTHSLLVQALAYRWILRCQLDFFRVRLKFCEKAEQYESAPWSIPAVAGGLYADMGSRACLTGLPEALAGCLGLQDRLARRPGPIGPALRSLCFDVAQVAEMSQRTRWQLEVKREVRDQVERFLASLDRVPEGRGRVIARIVRHHWDWGSALLPKLRKERADRARVDLDRLAGLLDRSETVQIDEMRQRLSVVRID